jgi:hypothetical protein
LKTSPQFWPSNLLEAIWAVLISIQTNRKQPGSDFMTTTKEIKIGADSAARALREKAIGAEEMRFLLGVLVGYSMRGRKTLLMAVLATATVIAFIILPAIALSQLAWSVQRERQSRPAQTRVPSLKGLSYEDAEAKLRAANLKIRVLATRSDLALQPGLIIDQSPLPGEQVNRGHAVGVTVSKANSVGPDP